MIEYDCMPTYANILVATIVDMDDNRVIKSFAIKKGIELENKVNIMRIIKNDYYYDSLVMSH